MAGWRCEPADAPGARAAEPGRRLSVRAGGGGGGGVNGPRSLAAFPGVCRPRSRCCHRASAGLRGSDSPPGTVAARPCPSSPSSPEHICRLPLNRYLEENVDLDETECASLDAAIPDTNVGYRLLQKLGWRGGGLGREQQGASGGAPQTDGRFVAAALACLLVGRWGSQWVRQGEGSRLVLSSLRQRQRLGHDALALVISCLRCPAHIRRPTRSCLLSCAGIREPVRLDANDTGTRIGLGRAAVERQYTAAGHLGAPPHDVFAPGGPGFHQPSCRSALTAPHVEPTRPAKGLRLGLDRPSCGTFLPSRNPPCRSVASSTSLRTKWRSTCVRTTITTASAWQVRCGRGVGQVGPCTGDCVRSCGRGHHRKRPAGALRVLHWATRVPRLFCPAAAALWRGRGGHALHVRASCGPVGRAAPPTAAALERNSHLDPPVCLARARRPPPLPPPPPPPPPCLQRCAPWRASALAAVA